jgi:hypothetical protein
LTIGKGDDAAEPEPESRTRQRPGNKWKLALAGLIGAYTVLGGYDLVANSNVLGGSTVATAAKTVTPAVSGARPAAAPAGPASAPGVSATGTSVPRPLVVESIAAFGPEGTSDGDNPDIASRVLHHGTDQPWYSQWYATPDFGDLRSGTGLLLDMGKAVTVRNLQLGIGNALGTDVQVRVGNSPVLDLPTVASARDVGGDVRLTASTPAEGRYVLVWFTRLPPVGQGHYQVSVYNVSVDG